MTDMIRGVPQDKIDAVVNNLAIKRLGTYEDCAQRLRLLHQPRERQHHGAGHLPGRNHLRTASGAGDRTLALRATASDGATTPALVWRDARRHLRRRCSTACASGSGELARHAAWGRAASWCVEGGFSPERRAPARSRSSDCGAIAVPLTPLVARAPRRSSSEIAEAQLHRSSSTTHDSWTSIHARIASVTHALTQKLVRRRHPGLVIFSSGSTGEPKAVLHDFAALLEKFQRPGSRKRTLTFLLVRSHRRHRHAVLHARQRRHPGHRRRAAIPDVVCQSHRARTASTRCPTSPTFLNLLLISEAWQQHDLSSLQVIAYGTEPMPESTLGAAARGPFPRCTLVQTYGMSGARRAALAVARTSGSLWMKFSGEGFETKIVDGMLWVRSADGDAGLPQRAGPLRRGRAG